MEERSITLPELEAMLGSIRGETWALVDAAGTIVYAVGPAEGLLGRGPGEDSRLLDYAHPDDLGGVVDGMRHVMSDPGSQFRTRARGLHGDGTYRLYDMTAVNCLGEAPLDAVVVRITEVHDEAPATGGVIESLAEAVPTPILLADHAGNVLYANDPARALVGDHLEAVAERLAAERDASLTFTLGDRWIRAHVASRASGIVAMLDGMPAHREPTIDPLTGAADRAELDAALARALGSEDTSPVSVLFVQLVALERVDDDHGPAGRDQVLKVVAARLKSAVRPGDVVARIGDDEFGIVCVGLPAESAPGFADRLVASVAATINVGVHRLSVAARAATASAPPAPRDVAGLLAAADALMERDATVELWAPTIEL